MMKKGMEICGGHQARQYVGVYGCNYVRRYRAHTHVIHGCAATTCGPVTPVLRCIPYGYSVAGWRQREEMLLGTHSYVPTTRMMERPCSVAAGGRGGERGSMISKQTAVDIPHADPYATEHGTRFDHVRKWVVYSDLHVSMKTIHVCMEVLERVHTVAQEHGAGVIFLGDFWDMRGALPVEPLNRVIDVFRYRWKVPMIALVGNHDQTTLGGQIHSLEAVEAAAVDDLVYVVDRPTILYDALWVPYRRHKNDVVDIMGACDELVQTRNIEAVFAHVDVVGAKLNDSFQALNGIEPAVFPQGIPIYSGHYHKPHMVPGTNIRYVGSPYQVTRGERGQQKSLLLLDRDSGWQVEKEIPIDIGPRYFDIALDPTSEGLAIDAGSGNVLVDGSDPIGQFGMRSQDRIRLIIPGKDMLPLCSPVLKSLEKHNIHVQIALHHPKIAKESRIPKIEDLGPVEIFQEYAAMHKFTERQIDIGLDILKQVRRTESHISGNTRIELDFVEVENYFSFKGKTRYPLIDRGIVVVTGKVSQSFDDGSMVGLSGMDSNGAGKTALVMAPLWAITGDVDSRSESGTGRSLRVSGVIRDGAKSARVLVQGWVNGRSFTVERIASKRGGRSSLSFILGDENLTQQEMAMTQKRINQELGAELFGRTSFYGQSEISMLLECTDTAFKSELGKIVDVDTWNAAKVESSKRLNACRAALAAAKQEEEFLDRRIWHLQEDLEHMERDIKAMNHDFETEIDNLERQIQNDTKALQAVISNVTSIVDLLRNDTLIETLPDFLERDESLVDLRKQQILLSKRLSDVECRKRQLQDEVSQHQRKMGALNQRVLIAEKALADFVGLQAGSTTQHVCDRCYQEISETRFENTKLQLERDLQQSQAACEEATRKHQSMLDLLREHVQEAQTINEQNETINEMMEIKRKSLEAQWYERNEDRLILKRYLEEFKSVLAEANSLPVPVLPRTIASQTDATISISHTEEITLDIASATLKEYQKSKVHLEASIDALVLLQKNQGNKRAMNLLLRDLQRKKADLSNSKQEVETLERKIQQYELEETNLKCLDETFRQTGIVSYSLEEAIHTLEQLTAAHLDSLSSDMTFEMLPYRKAAASEKIIDQIERIVYVKNSASGESVPRSIKQLSGGERRRISLALALGFTDLASKRGKLQCNLLVLDEIQQHLDNEGILRLVKLLRKRTVQMDHLSSSPTVLLVAQSNTWITDASGCDSIDVVEKEGGESSITFKS